MSHYTKIPGVPDTDNVRYGMAYFEGTGPEGTRCGTCQHRGYHYTKDVKSQRSGQWQTLAVQTNGCKQFRKMTGRIGPPVKETYRSCKYYEARPK